MGETVENTWRGSGVPLDAPWPRSDAAPVSALLAQCPSHAPTALIDSEALAGLFGVRRMYLKDERSRMGLGSFKALGAAHAIARAAKAVDAPDPSRALTGRVFVAASAGNHGLSVAAGARIFGARAVIYLADTVPESFADRLRAKEAEVVRAGETYENSMRAAERDAAAKGWTLLSDSSWPGYTDLPMAVMEGYLQLAAEAVEQIGAPPTHILLQAGVGGLAAAVAAHARRAWGDAPTIIVVEPEAAPALAAGISAGHVVDTLGPVSCMGRLDCKTASMIALKGLSRDADLFVTVSEDAGRRAAAILADAGYPTTPSGAAGIAALLEGVVPGPDARVMAILSEGGEGG